ncbi:MAG: hypothetical protein FWE25_05610, partial [Lachnospiraceae bacterium]|nr:hypothetical protein [Lachnospiraceae bacterium]
GATAMTVTGIFQRGADSVTVYVNGVAHNATLNRSNNEFSVIASGLPGGWHMVYATQTIGGIESVKTADRFIRTGTAAGVVQSSNHTREQMSLMINDPRPTFCGN